MKKLILLIIAFSFALAISAQEAETPEDAFVWALIGDGTYPEDEEPGEEVAVAEEEVPLETEEEAPRKFRFKNRGFELGLVNTTVGVSNNFLSLDEIFSEVVVLDLEKLAKGLRFDVGLDIRPLYFFVNQHDEWGFGLDIGRVSAFGNIDVSGNLINFKKTDGDKFGAGAAAFIDIGGPFFFHIHKLNGFKLKFRPALYVPAVYLAPDMMYSYKDLKNGKGSIVELDYNLQLYAIVPLGGENESSSPNYSMGFDFSAGTEYPLFDWLDLGVDITNIPFIPGSLNHYMKMKGNIKIDTSKFALDSSSLDKMFKPKIDEGDPYGEEKKMILRPFKMVFYANYRPFDTEILTVIPKLGFAINGLYAQPASLEIGASARCDLANLFIPSIGINYTDRMWKNSLDMILNFRAFELDLGTALQSPSFTKSWSGAGLSVNVGLKFGW